VDHPVLGNSWMVWNLWLALVPAVLALILFRPSLRRGATWWLGAAVFVAFLPNAPYVITDVVHLPPDLRAASPSTAMTMGVLGAYAAFIVIGFAAYAFSVLRLVGYLRANGVDRIGLIAAELSVHVLATIGIVLGRMFRFNSWDLIAQPGEVLDKLRVPQTQRGVAIVITVLAALAIGTLLFRALLVLARRAWPAAA
jgi:uncharacterized membrane protein